VRLALVQTAMLRRAGCGRALARDVGQTSARNAHRAVHCEDGRRADAELPDSAPLAKIAGFTREGAPAGQTHSPS